MAENNLSWPHLRARIEQAISFRAMPKWVSNYTGMGGSSEYLDAVSGFMSTHLTDCTIEPERILTSAGATAVLELASWILCDEGDAVAQQNAYLSLKYKHAITSLDNYGL